MPDHYSSLSRFNFLLPTYLVLIVFTSGCTSTRYSSQDLSTVNRALEGRSAQIQLLGDFYAWGYSVEVGPDSVSWLAVSDDQFYQVPTSDVLRIDRRRRSNTKLKAGVLLAALAGTIAYNEVADHRNPLAASLIMLSAFNGIQLLGARSQTVYVAERPSPHPE